MSATSEVILKTAASGVARDNHYALNPVSGLYERSTLLESQRTNLCLWNRDMTNAVWTKRGTAVATKTAVGIDGVANSATLLSGVAQLGAGDVYQTSMPVAGGSFPSPSFWIRKQSSTGTLRFGNPQDGNKGGWDINFALLGSGWERITRTHPAVTVVSEFTDNGTLVGIHFMGTAGVPLSFNVDMVQMETPIFPSTVIQTGAAAATRAADLFSMPLTAPPQEMTVYTRGVDTGTDANGRIWAIGSGGDPRMVLYNGGSQILQLYHNNGTAAVYATTGAVPSLGNLLETRCVLNANGTLVIGTSVNEGTEALQNSVGAIAGLAGAWSGPTFHFNNEPGAYHGNNAFQNVQIARGIRTMQWFRDRLT